MEEEPLASNTKAPPLLLYLRPLVLRRLLLLEDVGPRGLGELLCSLAACTQALQAKHATIVSVTVTVRKESVSYGRGWRVASRQVVYEALVRTLKPTLGEPREPRLYNATQQNAWRRPSFARTGTTAGAP